MVNEIKVIIFISFNILIFAGNSDIINNPVKSEIEKNPLDFYILFNSCHAKTFGVSGEANKDIIIKEENNKVNLNDKSYTYSTNMFLCNNDTDNGFLFAKYSLYSITKNSDGNITLASIYKSIQNNYKYFGYLLHDFEQGRHKEIILYGINERNIFFIILKRKLSIIFLSAMKYIQFLVNI